MYTFIRYQLWNDLQIFRREFGPDSPLLDVVAKFEDRRDSWIKECPSLVVTITGGHRSLEKVR